MTSRSNSPLACCGTAPSAALLKMHLERMRLDQMGSDQMDSDQVDSDQMHQ